LRVWSNDLAKCPFEEQIFECNLAIGGLLILLFGNDEIDYRELLLFNKNYDVYRPKLAGPGKLWSLQLQLLFCVCPIARKRAYIGHLETEERI
jgi:hypothetical protein